MDPERLRIELQTLLDDVRLLAIEQLIARQEASEFIDYIGRLVRLPGKYAVLEPLYRQAQDLQARLAAIDQGLYAQVQADLMDHRLDPAGFRALLDRFTPYRPNQPGKAYLKDESLDLLISHALFPWPEPQLQLECRPEMVHYEATPGRMILELVDRLHLGTQDIFYDLGAGLGHVILLVHLLTGVRTVGVECEPVYCEYLHTWIKRLGLSGVEIIQGDAREADLTPGTAFFLFTPFIDALFDQVMERLHQVALQHRQAGQPPVRICTLGTCTPEVARLPWLQIDDPAHNHDFKLAIFTSDC